MSLLALLKEKERRTFKGLFFLTFLTLFLVLVPGLVGAVDISYSNFRYQDSATVSERYYAVDITVKGTGQRESGIIELGLNEYKPYQPPIGRLAFVQQKLPCEATYPWNVHAYYVVGVLGGYDQVKFTLIGRGIPDGTYNPYVLHATGCFNARGEFKQPQPGFPKGWIVTFGSAQAPAQTIDQCDGQRTALQYLQGKGDVACYEAACDNPSSTASVARCVKRGECGDGAEQLVTCADGSSVNVRVCENFFWVETGKKCPEKPLPVKPEPTTQGAVRASLGGGPSSLSLVVGGSLVFGGLLLTRRWWRRLLR